SWLSFLTKTAREAVEVGDFRGDLDTGQFARELYGIALAYKYFDKLMGDEAAEASARASFERLLSTSRPTP
ncbi:MAG: TetR/AcrR family transcriptional regulator, partial [Acidobacteria bacterium]|nr:TetR/AcrR family transcriptional regulator [Acidobacteriota bacterium]